MCRGGQFKSQCHPETSVFPRKNPPLCHSELVSEFYYLSENTIIHFVIPHLWFFGRVAVGRLPLVKLDI